MLTYVDIGKKVSAIGRAAFSQTPWLDSQSDEFVIAGDGVLIKYNGDAADVEVPSRVKYISDAFSSNNSVRTVTVSGKTEHIGNGAFALCRAEMSFAECSGVDVIFNRARHTRFTLDNLLYLLQLLFLGNQ